MELKKFAGYTIRTIWVLLCNFICIPSYVAWLVVVSPFYLVSPDIFNQLEQVFFSWLLTVVSCWCWSAGYDLAESGANLDHLQHHRLLILPNHQSTADPPEVLER